MEKERYEITYDGVIYDIYDNEIKQYISKPDLPLKEHYRILCDLLNQQSARIKELEEENQQLRQQLSDEENAHDLCIDSFNEECEKLRKQIKFESEARVRFKQSQNQKAIKVIESIRRYLDYQVRTSKFSYNEYVDFVNLVFSAQIDILLGKQYGDGLVWNIERYI